MPRPDLVARALALIEKSPINHAYFFRKLDTPGWIEPLGEAGLFKNPPPARLVDDDVIIFPSWPESEYLARMAPLAPKEVGAAILGMPATANESVHRDLARAAAHIPVRMAACWAKREAEWIAEQEEVDLPIADVFGPVIRRLAASEEVGVAMALARALLELRVAMHSDEERLVRESSVAYGPAAASDGRVAEALVLRTRCRIVTRINKYEYRELLRESAPALVKHGGPKALAMLCDILEKPRGSNDRDGYADTLYRPAIEPHGQNYRQDATDFLIDAVRDGSMQLVADGTDIRRVAETLDGRRGTLFRRILLHVAKEHCSRHPRFAAALAVSEDRFFDDRFLHEYSGLLGAVFPMLGRSERATVMKWIESGPFLDDRFDGDRAGRRRIRLRWQARRLGWIRKDLDDEWKRRYAGIVAEVGEPDHPDAVSHTATWTGPTSPVGVKDLAEMSAPEVAAYMESWEPTGDPMSPDREGLARAVEEVIARFPSGYLAARDSFVDLPARYVVALVRGMHNAVRADRLMDWPAGLSVLFRVVKRSAGDREWRCARRESASMLATGLKDDVISPELRAAIWALIDVLALDPDPAPEDELEPTMDAATKSLNCVRGNALHAVIHYALWVCRTLLDPNGAKPDSFSMDTIPEVRKRLDWHLDPANDPSLAVRSVYGRWFPHLALLDADWAERNVERIFPHGQTALRDAAWEAYLRFCPAYDTPFEMLRDQYAAAVSRLAASGRRTPSTRDELGERLGVHLLAMAGRGRLSWDGDDGLLRGYFENAKPDQARGAIVSVGRDLNHVDRELPPEILAMVDQLRGR